MPGFLSRSLNAMATWISDDDGNVLGTAANPLRTQNASGTGTDAQQVQGTAANGANTSGNPVLIAGYDGTAARTVRTSAQGYLTLGVQTNVTDVPFGQLALTIGSTGNASTLGMLAYCSDGVQQRYLRGDTSGLFIGAGQCWTESTTALAASATLVGTARSTGAVAGGVGSRFSFFIAEAFSDVAGGTLFADKSTDGGTTWRQTGSIALVAGTSVTLKIPLSAVQYRARVLNGATAQNAALVTTAMSLN